MSTNQFDKKAADWDKKKKRVQVATAIAKAMADFGLTKDMAAMEYGCGTGLVGLTLAPGLGSLLAIDSSAGMLKILAEKIDKMRIDNVTTLQTDLTTDSIEGTFDCIFTSMTLHHVEHVDGLINRFFDLLNRDGLLLIADLVEEDGSFHGEGAEGIKHHGFNPDHLAEKLEACGFSDCSHQIVHTFDKTGKDGITRNYPVFLLNCVKK